MEILAPVNADTLDAALNAGANAVYFGLKKLNARRGAKNFTQDELAEVVRKIHQSGAQAHLTLNIDLSPRDTGLAARTLAFAAQCGVDAVIVRDPAVLALRPFFPRLAFHLSTQSGVSSSAGVQMARELGCDRVVLARELTRKEIQACCRISDIDIEVFGQGALCFCCSGRCLLSSWVGGRSGNRGACASPCRVGWKSLAPDSREEHPLSMKDLCLVENLPELSRLGVASLKIEGRLKSAQWVAQAVETYRKAHDAVEELPLLRQKAETLGGYTGRALTQGYYAGIFAGLTEGDQGRVKSACACCGNANGETVEPPHLEIHVSVDAQNGTCFDCHFGNNAGVVRIPYQRIANPRRAVALAELLDALQERLPQATAAEFLCPDDLSSALYPRRCEEMLYQGIMDFLRQATKEDDGNIHVALPEEILSLQTLHGRSPQNKRNLGTPPDLVRFRLDQAGFLAKNFATYCTAKSRVIFPVTGHDSLEEIRQAIHRLPENARENVILALPPVCYEDDLPALRTIVGYAAQENLLLEVNSWDTLFLAREANAGFVTGQGLAVLNPLAARMLALLGAQWCAVSCEIDQQQLEELTATSEIPLSLTLLSAPALMTTRAELPEHFAPLANGKPGTPFQDARKTLLSARKEGVLTTLRPLAPFDWRGIRNANIAVAHLETDYSGMDDLQHLEKSEEKPFLFNYDRQLR